MSGRRSIQTAQETRSLRNAKYNKLLGEVKQNFCPSRGAAPAYFKAFKRADRRDLYREAVFSCNTPFWIALSSAETVCR